jgi:hypothetical protein
MYIASKPQNPAGLELTIIWFSGRHVCRIAEHYLYWRFESVPVASVIKMHWPRSEQMRPSFGHSSELEHLPEVGSRMLNNATGQKKLKNG